MVSKHKECGVFDYKWPLVWGNPLSFYLVNKESMTEIDKDIQDKYLTYDYAQQFVKDNGIVNYNLNMAMNQHLDIWFRGKYIGFNYKKFNEFLSNIFK
jgi:hypothetical protein